MVAVLDSKQNSLIYIFKAGSYFIIASSIIN